MEALEPGGLARERLRLRARRARLGQSRRRLLLGLLERRLVGRQRLALQTTMQGS